MLPTGQVVSALPVCVKFQFSVSRGILSFTDLTDNVFPADLDPVVVENIPDQMRCAMSLVAQLSEAVEKRMTCCHKRSKDEN
jgi:hypothetical protein